VKAAVVVAAGNRVVGSFLASEMKARNRLVSWPATAHAWAAFGVQ
jgi:hypothetical protein